MNRDVLIALLQQKGIYTPELVEKFDKFCDEVLETNRSFNLTAITDRDEFYAKHFVDSLAGYDFVKDAKTVCDIGSGAGFPGVPLGWESLACLLTASAGFCLILLLSRMEETQQS